MRIIGNDQKNNGQEILERIMGKISSIIGAGLLKMVIYKYDEVLMVDLHVSLDWHLISVLAKNGSWNSTCIRKTLN